MMKTRYERKTRFIEKAIEKGASKDIDYSFVNYVNNRTPVLLYDGSLDKDGNAYGFFMQTPCNHLRGKSRKKRAEKISKSKKADFQSVVERFRKAHPNESLDYSKSEYRGMHEKILIIDHDLRSDGAEYGEYWQEPSAHLKGCGHPDKGRERTAMSHSYGKEDFVEKVRKANANKFIDLTGSVYEGSQKPTWALCRKTDRVGKMHGRFRTTPERLWSGKGCPKCAMSHMAETVMAELSRSGICYECEKKFAWLGQQRLDFYVPSCNVAIECQGEQHYVAVPFSSGTKEGLLDELKKRQEQDKEKYEKCAKNGLRIVYYSNPSMFQTKEPIDVNGGFYSDKILFTDAKELAKYIMEAIDGTISQ